jgi:hypothetical protein
LRNGKQLPGFLHCQIKRVGLVDFDLLDVQLVTDFENDEVLQVSHLELLLLLDLGSLCLEFLFYVLRELHFQLVEQSEWAALCAVLAVVSVEHSIVQGVCVGIGIAKGLFYFQNVDHGNPLVVKAIPLAVLKGLDIRVIMPVVGSAIVHQDCIQLIHQGALLEIGFDELIVFGLQLKQLLLLFCLKFL